ncbi:unnamed protein product [Urochloa humidicola]
MPNLQILRFDAPVMACNNLGLECLPSLRKVEVSVDCKGASADDVEKAEAELRYAAQRHPNGPIIKIYRSRENNMMGQQSTDTEPDQQEADVSSRADDTATPSC